LAKSASYEAPHYVLILVFESEFRNVGVGAVGFALLEL
jgi:hypothetical protein